MNAGQIDFSPYSTLLFGDAYPKFCVKNVGSLVKFCFAEFLFVNPVFCLSNSVEHT